MIFSSLNFLGFISVLFLLLIFFKNDRTRKLILLLASYVFYSAWDVRFLILIIACSVWSWVLGNQMYKARTRSSKKLLLALCLTLDISMLAYFKYANFFIESFAILLNIENVDRLSIILPVGISFFTFQAMSYNIDLYRNRIPLCESLPKFLLFVAFFPQLVAGPIVRASEFLPQLNRSIKLNWRGFIFGAQIFILGLLQKSVFGDNLSKMPDAVFVNPGLYDTPTLWLALLAYTGQIFCDFSGYSLMAIGVARMLSFKLPVNFNAPYISGSITEFWRRWHITLSRWLRDYLYFSLGGNRKGILRTYVNLMITMLLGGLWHARG